MDKKIINFHTHCFPDKIAEKAIKQLNFSSGGIDYYTDGTLSGIKSEMKRAGIFKSVVLSIATNEKQQKNVNNFAAEISKDEDIIAFGSVHPDAEDALEELERIKDLGLPGVKFHPEFQNFFVDDEKMKEIYKKISELKLITVFHSGGDLGYPEPMHCSAKRLAKALEWFSSPVIAAHWGGAFYYEDTLKYLCGKDVYFDTSFGYRVVPKPYAQKIIERHGADKILFGSDTPWSTPEMEMKLINTLDLSDGDKDKIYHKNAEKLLGI